MRVAALTSVCIVVYQPGASTSLGVSDGARAPVPKETRHLQPGQAAVVTAYAECAKEELPRAMQPPDRRRGRAYAMRA